MLKAFQAKQGNLNLMTKVNKASEDIFCRKSISGSNDSTILDS